MVTKQIKKILPKEWKKELRLGSLTDDKKCITKAKVGCIHSCKIKRKWVNFIKVWVKRESLSNALKEGQKLDVHSETMIGRDLGKT